MKQHVSFWNSLAFSMIQQTLAIWFCCSSAFSKSSVNICKFMVHILLKPSLENFEHYFATVWDEWNCVVVWTLFGIAPYHTSKVRNCGCTSLEQPGGDIPCSRSEKPQKDSRHWSSGCSVLEQLWEDTPCSRAKGKPQQDGRRGEFAFRIKPHTSQRCSEGSNKPCAHQDPETPQKLRLCLSVSCGGTGQWWTTSGEVAQYSRLG